MTKPTTSALTEQVSKSRLLTILEQLRSLPVLVIGDVILDRYVWGKVDRISPEAPVPVVEVTALEDRLGGAGNVARNLARLGCAVNLCGFVGDDDDGQVLLRLLDNDRIGRTGMTVDPSRPSVLKTRVIAHSQQVVRIDRELRTAPSLEMQAHFAGVVEDQLSSAKVIIISDYGKGSIGSPLLKKLESAQIDGRISLSSRPLVVDPHPASYELYSKMSVAKPNRKEAELAIGRPIRTPQDAAEACRLIMKKWQAPMAVITLGEDGMVLLDPAHAEGITIPTEAREVFDVSGAGDTVTAVFSAALGSGATGLEAGVLANIAAGIVVSEVGTVAIDPVKLSGRIEERA